VKPHLCASEGPTSPKGLWAILQGRVGRPNLIYLNLLILHAALNQKRRGERAFFHKELILFLDRVRGKALQVPYVVPANSGGIAT
jgi:hypothetical protein